MFIYATAVPNSTFVMNILNFPHHFLRDSLQMRAGPVTCNNCHFNFNCNLTFTTTFNWHVSAALPLSVFSAYLVSNAAYVYLAWFCLSLCMLSCNLPLSRCNKWWPCLTMSGQDPDQTHYSWLIMLLNKMYQLGNNGVTIDWSVSSAGARCHPASWGLRRR